MSAPSITATTQEVSITDDLSKQLGQLGCSHSMTIDQLLDLPEKRDVAIAPTGDHIVARVTNFADDDDDDDGGGEVIPVRHMISVRDAMVTVSNMERLLLQYLVEYAASSNALQKLRKQFTAIVQKCTRQRNILDYFPNTINFSINLETDTLSEASHLSWNIT